MTFLEAALKILTREGRPLHFKELTERAMTKKLLTFVGRTPEVTMQTQLTAAVKKAPGNPFVRVKPGVFGLLRYPEVPPEEPAPPPEKAEAAERPSRAAGPSTEGDEGAGRGRRRRRRGGRGRGRDDAPAANGGAPGAASDNDLEAAEASDEPTVRGLSAAARAAALAATGVLEGDDDDASSDAEGEDMPEGHDARAGAQTAAGEELDAALEPAETMGPPPSEGDDVDGDVDEGEEDEAGSADAAFGGEAGAARGPDAARGDDLGPGRRRRRRRRRRGGEGEGQGAARPEGGGALGASGSEGGGELVPSAAAAGEGERAESAGAEGEGQGPRRIMTPVDAALEILRGQVPGRGVHVRQIADAAARRRLVHGEPNEAWRVMRAALAAEPRERLRAGQRPRVRAAGAGLFALARRPPDAEVERAELVFGEARRALRERTIAALERRIADLPAPAFEALARVLLQREGFGPATFVKRVEGTIYIEALRGRGSRPSKALIALRAGGSSAGRRAIGELRAGIRARGQEEGLLMLAGRLGDDAISEWKQDGQPIEIADGQAMAETCVRHGVGVITATVSVDFVDADFFAELSEG
ncbi:MAG TPA: HTH domain-containing protein [Polyangia bacterium]|nr:HTH domain-containing protein [Polyangia bacterium]